jgi:hypothetical protein
VRIPERNRKGEAGKGFDLQGFGISLLLLLAFDYERNEMK